MIVFLVYAMSSRKLIYNHLMSSRKNLLKFLEEKEKSSTFVLIIKSIKT